MLLLGSTTTEGTVFDDLVRGKAGSPATGRSIAVSLALHGGALGVALLFAALATRPEEKPEKLAPVIDFTQRGRHQTTPQGKPKEVTPGPRKPPPRLPKRPPLRLDLPQERVEIQAPPLAPPAPPQQRIVHDPDPDPDPRSVGASDPGAEGAPGDRVPGEPGGHGWIGEMRSGPPPAEEVVHTYGRDVGMTFPQPSSACRPPQPAMPEQARAAGITGRVLVHFVVHADGHVGEIRSLDPSTPRVLVEAVRAWLEGCPYQPALLSGQAVSAKISQSFNFRLH
jgi:TonB family protein